MSTKKLTSNSLKDLTFTDGQVKVIGASAVSKINADGTETKLQPIDSTAKKVTKKPVKAVTAETKPVEVKTTKATTKSNKEDLTMAEEKKKDVVAETETKAAEDKAAKPVAKTNGKKIDVSNDAIAAAAEQVAKTGEVDINVSYETESASTQFWKSCAAGAGVAAGALAVVGIVKLGCYLLSGDNE